MMQKCCLVMGVANQRSIAWHCVESFLQQGFECVFTFQDGKHQTKMETLRDKHDGILGCLPCNVASEIPLLFQENGKLVDLLQGRKLDAIVHSIAHATSMGKATIETTIEEYMNAHHISAYSFLETVRCSRHLLQNDGALPAYTALSYLGSTRAVPGYGIMGSAKASLESIVRALSMEQSDETVPYRCNAVSAGPLKTAASRGIPNFSELQNFAAQNSSCAFTAQDVANTVVWISCTGGITGQVVYVDGGFSSTVPVFETKSNKK